MTRDSKTSLYWTGSALAALVVLALIMWTVGGFEMGGALTTIE